MKPICGEPSRLIGDKRERKMKKKVLLVDDHPKVLRFLEIDLKLRGFEVFSTTSGQQALELVDSVKPDIMVLDIIMPEMDGFEVLRKLRAFTQLPVLAFSAHTGNAKSAIQLGANDFTPKPIDMDKLTAKINSLTNGLNE